MGAKILEIPGENLIFNMSINIYTALLCILRVLLYQVPGLFMRFVPTWLFSMCNMYLLSDSCLEIFSIK